MLAPKSNYKFNEDQFDTIQAIGIHLVWGPILTGLTSLRAESLGVGRMKQLDYVKPNVVFAILQRPRMQGMRFTVLYISRR